MLIDIAQREFAANPPKFHRGDAALFPAELFLHLRLDGQAMAIPTGDVGCSEAGHGLRLDHHVLENLVQGGSQVNCPCGIGWAIVQDVGRCVGARLLNAVYDSPDGAKNYTIGLMVDSLDNYPKTMPTATYVRSVRHQLEKDGLLTEREEFPVNISGVAFTGAILKVPEKPNFGYRRGIYSTFLNGYVLSLEIQARDQERIQQVLSFAVKIVSSK